MTSNEGTTKAGFADPRRPKMHLLHIGFGQPDDATEPDVQTLEEVFNKARSWLRYTPSCWILYTELSADEWCTRLEQILEPDKRHLFITRIDIQDCQGWITSAGWDWIKKHSRRLYTPQGNDPESGQ